MNILQQDPESLSVAISEAIADAEDVEPTDLDFALHDYVDPDALEALWEGTNTDWYLRFRIADHTVTVDGDGTITVDPLDG